MTDTEQPPTEDTAQPQGEGEDRRSLSPAAASNLSTTTKTPPLTQEITPRWLLRRLPWEEVSGGAYRVNRRLAYSAGGFIGVTVDGGRARVIPGALAEVGPLRGIADHAALDSLADAFTQREAERGETIAAPGERADRVVVIASGKVAKARAGRYGDEQTVATMADGEFFGEAVLADAGERWDHAYRAVTPCTLLELDRASVQRALGEHESLREHVSAVLSEPPPTNKRGEALISTAAGHEGEASLPRTFVDYDAEPVERELAVAQAVVRVHTRVADLYSEPMDQTEQQISLTAEMLRERQEHDILNSPAFGLLHSVDPSQRIQTQTGPPTPADMDALLGRRKKSRLFLAHPRAIAAFGKECSRRGVYPRTVEIDGSSLMSWRNVPILPCDKIPISEYLTSSILCMRTGAEDSGVVGLQQTGLPDEREPGLSVRFMGIDGKAIMSYLLTAYFSAAVMVPDALGVLTDVEIGQ